MALSQEIMASVQALDDSKYKKEKDLFNKVLLSAQSIMGHFSEFAKKNQFNDILEHCTDFLQFASVLVVAWRLLESARVAESKMGQADAAMKKYYESKVIDFKVYCAHYLIHNPSLAKTITDFDLDVSRLEV